MGRSCGEFMPIVYRYAKSIVHDNYHYQESSAPPKKPTSRLKINHLITSRDIIFSGHPTTGMPVDESKQTQVKTTGNAAFTLRGRGVFGCPHEYFTQLASDRCRATVRAALGANDQIQGGRPVESSRRGRNAMSATTRPPRRCNGCGRYTATMDGFHCPRCAPLARWLENPKKYPMPPKPLNEKENANI